MDKSRFRELQEKAANGKYKRLFMTLLVRSGGEWRTPFEHVEILLGFDLPKSAWTDRAWWANDVSHAHALAWIAAGWKTVDVDMASQTLTFAPDASRGDVDKSLFDLDVVWPVHRAGGWPPGLTLSREDMYRDDI